jgi:heat shock protein HtpX
MGNLFSAFLGNYISVPTDVQLYLNESQCSNAFAIGRKAICLTKGLLNCSDYQIKAVLGHEFGHLANKDTDISILLLSMVSNSWLIRKTLGVLLVLLISKSFRENEYEADEFSFNLGYGHALCEWLDSYSSNADGIFAILSRSHPDTDSRIGKLQTLGVTYKTCQ